MNELMYWQQVGQWESAHSDDKRSLNLKIGDLQQSKYLKKSDFEEPRAVTIKDIAVENVAMANQPKKERAVLYFREVDKGLVCNQTNLKRAAHFLGTDETDDWLGKKIVVYFDENVEFGGELVGGLRIKGVPKPPSRPTRDAAMDGIKGMDDDTPF